MRLFGRGSMKKKKSPEMSAPADSSLRFPIIVMSFNRPDYLEKVLESIRDQQGVDVGQRDIYLFQDAPVSTITGKRYAEDADIEASVAAFRRIFPQGRVMLPEGNLGVCKNFLRAESYAFETLKADCAYFFEDDMVLSPHYFVMMDRIARFALNSGRIGYFAAYGTYTMPLVEQQQKAGQMQRLGHHWAFGLTRQHWLEMHEWLKPYYDMVLSGDYGQRPTPKILKHYRDQGIPLGVSSQDDVKKVGTYALGRASINTTAVYARYIGERGVHMSGDRFAEKGYARTELYPDPVDELEFPSDERIDEFLKQEFAVRWRGIARGSDAIHKQSVERARKAMLAVHGGDIFEGFVPLPAADVQGWNGQHRAMVRLIEDLRPKLVLDVRVWKGQASIFLAKKLKENGVDGFVVSIDNFLGVPEQWRNAEGEPALPFANGRPLLYEQFLTNLQAEGVAETVVPLAMSPVDAVRHLKRNGLRPNLVHLDAAKDYATVLAEIEAYWDVLRPGGALIGDDYAWNHVRLAVEAFCERLGLPCEVDGPKWILRKPKEAAPVAPGAAKALAEA